MTAENEQAGAGAGSGIERAEPGGVRVRRALLSVSEKTGVLDFARGLVEQGVEIVSTGGTASALRDGGVPVRAIEDFTGFPEMMDGRVKTLHPRLYAGLLAVRNDDEHLEAAAEHSIEPVDLVCVNLYPDRRARRRERRGDRREHRHRWSHDDPRGGQEQRVCRGRCRPR
jgi:phosphoribosylaminoimidazolecarboxamide formyltransferase/IMP cyclohydrolase